MSTTIQSINETESLFHLVQQECLVLCKPSVAAKLTELPQSWELAPLEFLFLVQFAASPACLDASMGLSSALAPAFEAARTMGKRVILADDVLLSRKNEVAHLAGQVYLTPAAVLTRFQGGSHFQVAS